jgi:hypothetical protein
MPCERVLASRPVFTTGHQAVHVRSRHAALDSNAYVTDACTSLPPAAASEQQGRFG